MRRSLKHSVGRSVLVSALMLAVAGCLQPHANEADLEARIAAREHPRILARFGGALEAPVLAAHVAAIGGQIHAVASDDGAPFRFILLDDAAPNAFSLPGGTIYVTRGLLALTNDDAELAAILAHEIAHVEARHALQRLDPRRYTDIDAVLTDVLERRWAGELSPERRREAAALAAAAYLQRFSRQQEFDADRLAVGYLRAAAFDPGAMARVLRTLAAYDALRRGGAAVELRLLASHPLLPQRIAAAERVAGSVDRRSVRGLGMGQGAAPRNELLAAVDRLLFGADPAAGLVRDGRFVHPRLAITFALPAEMDVVHDDDWLIGRAEQGLVMVLDTPHFDNGRAAAQGGGLEFRTFEAAATIDGAPAQMRTTMVRDGERAVFRLRFVKPGTFTAVDRRTVASIVASFRRLSASEVAAVPRREINVVTVAPGQSIADLAASMEVQEPAERLFRILNGLDADASPAVGEQVKIVRRVRASPPQTTNRASNPSSS